MKQQRQSVALTTQQAGALRVNTADGTIKVDTALLPIPTNVYDADVAWACDRDGTVSLFFAKRQVTGSGLRSRIQVKYAYEPFYLHFWKHSRDFHARVRASYPTRLPRRPFDNPDDLTAMHAEREHSDWANYDILAQHGTQACVDLYRIPPSAIARLAADGSTSGLTIEPILRVYLTTADLCRLLDICEPIAETVRSWLPQEELP